MRRTELLGTVALLAAAAATGNAASAPASSVSSVPRRGKKLEVSRALPLAAFLLGPDLVPIDVFGPHSVLLNAAMTTADMHPLFAVTTVAETLQPIDASGMKLQPQHTFAEDVRPNVLFVPAQHGSPAAIEYIRHASRHADVTASICTGAFLVAEAGLFDGGRATTHHDAYDDLQQRFPRVTVIRGPRYVEDVLVSSSGGETCGIDLALRIVERYYGAGVAASTAFNMEYRRTPRPASATET